MKLNWKRETTLGALCAVGMLLSSTAAIADTLSDALISAYQTSPTLKVNQAASILLNAITAYVDVRRDMRFVNLADNNIRVISQQVEAARDRFDVGEVTRTDVSQADARLASARSNLATNRGAFQRSEQAYELAVSVSLGANVTYGVNTQIFGDDQVSGSVSLNGSMPLFDGGTNDSLVRQAYSVLDRRKAELQDAARTVQQNTAISWANLEVARASIRSSRQQIRAARVAFDGIQEEAKLGARTTLDVLDAEQEVLNAESGLTAAQRDEYVAAYNLVSSMGLLTTQYLKLGIEPYDPNAYYSSINKKPLTPEGTALSRIGSRWDN